MFKIITKILLLPISIFFFIYSMIENLFGVLISSLMMMVWFADTNIFLKLIVSFLALLILLNSLGVIKSKGFGGDGDGGGD